MLVCYGLLPVDLTNKHQGYFMRFSAIIPLPQTKWSNPEDYGQMFYMN